MQFWPVVIVSAILCVIPTGGCEIGPNNVYFSSAIAALNGIHQDVIGCRNNATGEYEVHVLAMGEPTSSQVLRSNVTVQGETNRRVLVVLVDVGNVLWSVKLVQNANVTFVIHITNSTSSSVDLSQLTNTPLEQTSFPDNGEYDRVHLITSLERAFAPITSYTEVSRADKWTLTLGNIPLSRNESASTAERCLKSNDCWLQYNFTYDDNWNDCHGEQYVKRTTLTVGKYVGVVLCSSTRYKLVMSDSLEDQFLNMADGSGSGSDHCILIGGQESSARLAGNGFDSPSATGYYRSFPGERFQIGRIGFGPKNMSAWTGLYYNTWYECGVRIPGNITVVPFPTNHTTANSSSNTWDDVPFGQTTFTVNRTFIVPAGVTKLDVICIGGGGGGRDGHSVRVDGGDGGNTTFGYLLIAGGGKGANADGSGGEGGFGTVASGGQGGVGGGCSAGGGAAGQTSGGGHNGLEAGSSTYPFCGAGGSSGGSSCGNIFGSIEPGRSGPGGTDPQGRAAGSFGGGGGSRAGGRAGGGGGYSRATIDVAPGQRIPITVGRKGRPSYWAGKPADGILVVSWGGPIRPFESFVDMRTVSEEAPPATTNPPLLPETTLPRKSCTNYCSGGYRLGAACINGYCECNAEGYNKYTCLPDIGTCRILPGQTDRLGLTPSTSDIIFSCVGSSENSTYEVHVIGMYENTGSRSTVYPTNVIIEGRSEKPMILVVTSYEAVRWQINGHPNLDLREVLLFSYKEADSSVSVSGVSSPESVKVNRTGIRQYGYGDDSGGGYTAQILSALKQRFGSVASFSGTYSSRSWTLSLPAPRIVWDDVPFGQAKFFRNRIVVVPAGVTKMDVIVIGGGGGGRDSHIASMLAGDGEDSSFGNFLMAEGGRGGKLGNSGGQGGFGRVASGGQGGVGGGCSAGGGAAGQTSGGGHNGLEAGSSTYPFCGAGGSSGGSSCGNIFGSIEPGRSGPGGTDPQGRAAGSFGGGGGSRAGGRAGGGGGYSRATIDVAPGQRIPITVGRKGMPSYRPGKPADGIVVVSWGGPIRPLGTFIKMSTISEEASSTTISPSSTLTPSQEVSSLTGTTAADCLSLSTCWLRFNFSYDASYTACTGMQFVRKTRYAVGKYIGLVLCSPFRYKLLMADDLQDTFLNIGDGSGSGEDQCELIGGDENEAVTSGDFWDSPWAIGYSRAFVSSSFRKGPIGFGPKDGSNWTGKYYPTWYECGVSVPGNSTVVDYVITSENEWDDVQFGQMKFLSDGEFVVPTGVTSLDVVCIGGGGGGVDGHSAILGITADAGNGGNSTFGSYVWAEGGKGARLNSQGGEGGRGLTADGGQGGIGGGCSAGAGAAGQTSGGGGGLVPGSSTNPFCGAGGSSGGSRCGSEFENIDPGSSGPGGQDPVSRNGGLYGGGGGSRAGGRTGGGGGYSRSEVQVVPGQRISVTVGEYGTPHYANGRPGKGIVVVSWGGPIQPLGNFMN